MTTTTARVAAEMAATVRMIQRLEDSEVAARRAAMVAEGRPAAEIEAAITRWRNSVAAATEASLPTLAAQTLRSVTGGRGLH
ncbi:MAG: hypothetical protein GC206_17090 [Alphaproteobacteria bacterium]|nr:hypothetical protein [Alphaproteobacteria bacterium]